MPPGNPVGSHHSPAQGKSKRTRRLGGSLCDPEEAEEARLGSCCTGVETQVWKAFCWRIGLVQAEQMRMLWILRTPAGKKVQQGSSVLPFLPHWPRWKSLESAEAHAADADDEVRQTQAARLGDGTYISQVALKAVLPVVLRAARRTRKGWQTGRLES